MLSFLKSKSNLQLYSPIFLYCYVFFFAINTPLSIFSSYILCLIYVVIFKRFIFLRYSYNFIFIIFAYIVLCLPIFSLNFGITPLFYLTSSIFILLAIKILTSLSILELCSCLRMLYISLIITVVFFLVKSDNLIEPFEGLIPGSSTNAIPTYSIVLQITYSTIYFLHSRKLPLYSSICTMMISLIGLGRGAILISLSILLLTLVWNVANTKKDIKNVLYIGFTVVISASIGANDSMLQLFEDWYSTTKFSAGIYDVYREEMINDYLEKIDMIGFLTGVSYENTSIQFLYGNNPHNSFIRMHSFYGLFGIFIITISLFLPFLSRHDISSKFLLFILMLLIIARAFTEPVLFPTPLDLFYVLICFAPFKYNYVESKFQSSLS